MKNKLHKALKSILSIVLSIVMLSSFALSSFAVEKRYIKDVKLIYAESKSEAASYVPDGYMLLEYDLNEGTEYVFDVKQVYIAYSITTNPDEAITDIKMMNMNGGFVLSDYEEQLKNVKESVKRLADDVKAAVSMFVRNYMSGTSGARAAYYALNSFTVDEAYGQGLADYFLYGNPDDAFFVKLVLNAHQNVLSSIISALAMAVQGEAGYTWLDRLSQIYDPWTIVTETDYWDMANDLGDHFVNFYNVYNSIDHDLYKKGDTELNISEDGENAPAEDISASATNADVDNAGIEIL